jgi:predicted RNA-binding protein YlqC (UPF0109 family)
VTDLEHIDDQIAPDESGDEAPRGGNRPGDAEAVAALQSMVQYVVEALVDHPENAVVLAEQRGNMVSLSVRLPEEELGKVIGRGGRIAKSIRTALMVAGSQRNLRVSLDIDSDVAEAS